MIELVFPLSLPPPLNEHDSRDQARRQQALANMRTALATAGLQRSLRLALQPESPVRQEALAHEQWLHQSLGTGHPDEAMALALRGAAPDLRAAPAGRQAWLLRPVHLHLGLDHLVLAAVESDSLRLDKPQAWVDRLGEALEPDWALQAWSGPRGETFLRLETPGEIDWQAHSSLQAAGRSIDLYLPTGADARQWRRFLNHAQMLLHEHPLNEARALAGQLPVNGLWLEGRIGEAPHALLHRLNRHDANAALPDLLQKAATGVRQVLLFEDWADAARQGDAQTWMALWQDFPAFATPLRQALASHPQGQTLGWHFFGETGRLSLHSSPADHLRFWRRPLAIRDL